MENFLGIPPHALHTFHIHLCIDPHIMNQHPHDTATHMPPCGKIMAEITNHQKSPTTLHAPHIFHTHLHSDPHIVNQHPHDPAPQRLPHGKCTKHLSNCMTFQPHLKAFVPHHLDAYHAWQPKQKDSALSLCSQFGPCSHHSKFVADLQP